MRRKSRDRIKQSPLIKVSDDITDEVLHSVQRINQRLSSDNLRLSERYFKGEIHVLAHLRLGDDTKHVARFQREGDSFGWSEERAGQLGVAITAGSHPKICT